MSDQPVNSANESACPVTTLVVLLRLTQWHLDDVAHDLPAGRLTAEKRDVLAASLHHLAQLVRAVPDIVDGATQYQEDK